jgi:hypothetical protein
MTTKDFILIGAGAVVGYLLVGVVNKKKTVLDETKDATALPDTSSQTLPPNSTTETKESVVDPNLVICNENWNKFSKNKRFRSQQDKQSTYDKFIETCLVRT